MGTHIGDEENARSNPCATEIGVEHRDVAMTLTVVKDGALIEGNAARNAVDA